MFDLNSRKLIIMDDVVTTGSTPCAIIDAVLKVFSKANITAFSLDRTPTAKQQEYLRQASGKEFLLNESEEVYGNKRRE